MKVVDYLFDQGADINTQDNDGVINAGRLVIEFELASFPGKCTIAVQKQQFISIQATNTLVINSHL